MPALNNVFAALAAGGAHRQHRGAPAAAQPARQDARQHRRRLGVAHTQRHALCLWCAEAGPRPPVCSCSSSASVGSPLVPDALPPPCPTLPAAEGEEPGSTLRGEAAPRFPGKVHESFPFLHPDRIRDAQRRRP